MLTHARSLLPSDHHKQSIRDYTRVLDLDPNHVNAAYARAACHNMNGHFQLVRVPKLGHCNTFMSHTLCFGGLQANRDYDMALRKDKAKSA